MSAKILVKTSNLTKQYGKVRCVSSVNLQVPSGAIYGFLGPNGAGKSTTLKMILGLARPTNGNITLFDTPVNEKNRMKLLAQTGSLIESPSYYGHLTGEENLRIIQTLKGCSEKDIDKVLKIVRLDEARKKLASHYSLGMKQRLGLAAALLGFPRLLILDEPTNGLDPAGIQEMRELIRSLPEQYHMTVMVSSHLLSEIDQMADYAGIINKGQLIYQDSLLHLHEYSRRQLRLRTDNNTRALCILNEHRIDCSPDKDYLAFPEVNDGKTAFLISELVKAGIGILRVEEYQKSLEDIFLDLTGKQVSL